MLTGVTYKPTIVKNDTYVIIGSIDHGLEIPPYSIVELINSLGNVEALMMETPEVFHEQMHPLSTELLVKASVGKNPIKYLSGNRIDEEIGELVLKYAPKDVAELFVPCVFVRNCFQLGQKPTFESIVDFTSGYKERFNFVNIGRTIDTYMRVLQYWNRQKLKVTDLDDFSYDFEKFVGDIREFELWQPELQEFRNFFSGKIAVCVGAYHVPFVEDIFSGKKVQAPNWNNHIDLRREDKSTPQDADFLKNIYANLEHALK